MSDKPSYDELLKNNADLEQENKRLRELLHDSVDSTCKIFPLDRSSNRLEHILLGNNARKYRWLNEISKKVLAGISIHRLIHFIIDLLHEQFPHFRVAYSTIDTHGLLTVLKSRQPQSMTDLTGLEADLTVAPSYLKALLGKEPVVVSDVENDARMKPLKRAMQEGGTSAVLDVPVLHSENLSGILCLDACYKLRWTTHDIATLQEMASFMSLALQYEAVWSQLKEKEENLRITLNSIGDAVIATDVQGAVTHMNPVAEALTGWDVESAKGLNLASVFAIYNSNTRQKVDNPVAKVFETGAIVGLANHTMLVSKNGEEYQIADSAAPILDDSDQIQGVVLVFRDVTDEYKKANQLRHFQERLDLALKGSRAGIWDWNVQTGETVFDDRWARIAGYSLDELEPADIQT